MDINTTKTLNNGVEMPLLGLGVWQSQQGDEAKNAVLWALEAGYRHIDTAAGYGNERSVGEAIRQSGVKRESVFVTTKMAPPSVEGGAFEQAFHDSLEKLGMDYVDLYLIHWPVPGYDKAWKAMEDWCREGKIRAIGVSNFHQQHLDRLAQVSAVVPAADQIELHPHLSQAPLRAELSRRGIAAVAWSPLGHGTLLGDETILSIAAGYDKTAAQVMIRWGLQHGIHTIPKSVRRERITENADVFDFALSDEDMRRIDAMNIDRRTGRNPDVYAP